MRISFTRRILLISLLIAAPSAVLAQVSGRSFAVRSDQTVEIVNRFGRVDVSAMRSADPDPGEAANIKTEASLSASGLATSGDIILQNNGGKVRITVQPLLANKRIDLAVRLPERIRVRIETTDGEVLVTGSFELIEVNSETGTIAVDVPPDRIEYDLEWTATRPRVLSDFHIALVKEKSGGRFVIKGRFEKTAGGDRTTARRLSKTGGSSSDIRDPSWRSKEPILLRFTTARGIILLNVPPNEVPSNLRERKLTNAAKSIILSGNTALSEAIRRASPKFFGDFVDTQPVVKPAPVLHASVTTPTSYSLGTRTIVVRAIDRENRSIAGLSAKDFEISENGAQLELLSLRQESSPMNLVLLLDVSGSIDNYVNFIRRAARNFVEAVGEGDRISIVLFSDDVQVLSGFSSDKAALSRSLDKFDAGGSTAYYDALGYVLADTLKQLNGDRTAIVVLTDGDDNRSFLPFESLFAAIEESGAVIYPLYVPSALIAATATNGSNTAIDPLRTRYIALTSRAQDEGKRLADATGGIYFPITRLSQIETAYGDIVSQLRTAYRLTYRSQSPESVGGSSRKLRVRVTKPNIYVHLGPILTENSK